MNLILPTCSSSVSRPDASHAPQTAPRWAEIRRASTLLVLLFILTGATQSIASPPAPLSLLFLDDFSRPDTVEPGLGLPTLGPPWTQFGIGGFYGRYGCIRNQRFVTTAGGWVAVTYACQRLPSTPNVMEASVIWDPDIGAGTEGCLAMACGPTNFPGWFNTIAHGRFHRDQVAFDIFVNGEFFGNLGQTFFPPLPFGQTNLVRMALSPSSNTVALFVNDTLMLTVADSRLAAVSGPYAFWEHFYPDQDTRARTSMTRVAAYANESPIQLNLSSPANLGCGEVEIDGSVTTPVGVIERVAWDWGDGTITEGSPPAWHRYGQQGDYQVKVTAFSSAIDSTSRSVPVRVGSIDPSCENTVRVHPAEVWFQDGRTNTMLTVDIRDRSGHPVPFSPSEVALSTDRPDLIHLQPDGSVSGVGLGRARVFVQVQSQARTTAVQVVTGRLELKPAIMLLHLFPPTNSWVEIVAKNADGSPADLTGKSIAFHGGNDVATVDDRGLVKPLRQPSASLSSPLISATVDGLSAANACLVRVTELRLRKTGMENFRGRDVSLSIPTLNGTNVLPTLFTRLEAVTVLDALSARFRYLTGTLPGASGTQYVVLDPGSDVAGMDPCSSSGNPIRLSTGTNNLTACTGGEDWIQWGFIGTEIASNLLHQAGFLDFLAELPDASAYARGLAVALSVSCFDEFLSNPDGHDLAPATLASFRGTHLSLMPDTVRSTHFQLLKEYEAMPLYYEQFNSDILDAQLTQLADEHGSRFLFRLLSVFTPPEERFLGFANEIQRLTFWVAACSAAAGVDLRDRFAEKWGYPFDQGFFEDILPQLQRRAKQRDPLITKALLEGNQIVVEFIVTPGGQYQAQTSNDLATWRDLSTFVASDYATNQSAAIPAAEAQAFYRLLQLR